MYETTISPLVTLIDLIRRSQQSSNADELAFIVANESHLLVPYRQSALWFVDAGIRTLSGVVQIEANAPYAMWLNHVFEALATGEHTPRMLTKSDIAPAVAAEWGDWIPEYALWLPLLSKQGVLTGAIFMARDTAWREDEISLLAEWVSSWHHAWLALKPAKSFSWLKLKQSVTHFLTPETSQEWWKQRRVRLSIVFCLLLFVPVHLSVLAPAELVPSNPSLIRAPLDGVVGQFSVKPNEMVKAGQLLFDFEEATLMSRREVARQALATVEAEYRQQEQQALSDVKAKSQLVVTAGKIAEKNAEAKYVEGQVSRSHVLAPRNGIVLFDDPSEWVGRPVQTGERIMRIADPDEVELEAWVAVGDAVPLAVGAPVSLYLNASPLHSVEASVRYMSHEATQRPDGSFAYRVRAKLTHKTSNRVGLKGTARLNGERVPLIYWIIRRPLAVVRQTIGW